MQPLTKEAFYNKYKGMLDPMLGGVIGTGLGKYFGKSNFMALLGGIAGAGAGGAKNQFVLKDQPKTVTPKVLPEVAATPKVIETIPSVSQQVAVTPEVIEDIPSVPETVGSPQPKSISTGLFPYSEANTNRYTDFKQVFDAMNITQQTSAADIKNKFRNMDKLTDAWDKKLLLPETDKFGLRGLGDKALRSSSSGFSNYFGDAKDPGAALRSLLGNKQNVVPKNLISNPAVRTLLSMFDEGDFTSHDLLRTLNSLYKSNPKYTQYLVDSMTKGASFTKKAEEGSRFYTPGYQRARATASMGKPYVYQGPVKTKPVELDSQHRFNINTPPLNLNQATGKGDVAQLQQIRDDANLSATFQPTFNNPKAQKYKAPAINARLGTKGLDYTLDLNDAVTLAAGGGKQLLKDKGIYDPAKTYIDPALNAITNRAKKALPDEISNLTKGNESGSFDLKNYIPYFHGKKNIKGVDTQYELGAANKLGLNYKGQSATLSPTDTNANLNLFDGKVKSTIRPSGADMTTKLFGNDVRLTPTGVTSSGNIPIADLMMKYNIGSDGNYNAELPLGEKLKLYANSGGQGLDFKTRINKNLNLNANLGNDVNNGFGGKVRLEGTANQPNAITSTLLKNLVPNTNSFIEANVGKNPGVNFGLKKSF